MGYACAELYFALCATQCSKARNVVLASDDIPDRRATCPVAADRLALGYVFPGQPASPFSMQTTPPQMPPGGNDSRRVYDRDGTGIHQVHHRANKRLPPSAQWQRAKVGSHWRTELSWD